MIIRSLNHFGHAIRKARRAAGLSQSELEDRSGIRQETISRIENGQTGTRLETAFELLAALDLEITTQARTRGRSEDFGDMF